MLDLSRLKTTLLGRLLFCRGEWFFDIEEALAMEIRIVGGNCWITPFVIFFTALYLYHIHIEMYIINYVTKMLSK